MRIPRLAFIAVALMLASCGTSPQVQFYTLVPVAPVGESASSAPPFPVQVNAVHIPAVLDRNEIVRQSGTDALSMKDQDRWGAPLGEMARNVLAQNLAARLPTGSVIMPQAPAPSSAAHLVVDIVRFGENADRQVGLDGSWALLRGASDNPVLSGNVNLKDEAGGNDAASQVEAMSRLLGRLADDIAAKVAAATPAKG